MANESVNRTIQRESKMNFRIKYDILNGLTYEGYVNMNIRNTKGRMFLPQVATGLAWTDKMSNRSTDTSSDLLTINTENKLMYRKTGTINMQLSRLQYSVLRKRINPAMEAKLLVTYLQDLLILPLEVLYAKLVLVIPKHAILTV